MDPQEEIKNYLLYVSAVFLVFLSFAVPMLLRDSRHAKLKKLSLKEIRSGKSYILTGIEINEYKI